MSASDFSRVLSCALYHLCAGVEPLELSVRGGCPGLAVATLVWPCLALHVARPPEAPAMLPDGLHRRGSYYSAERSVTVADVVALEDELSIRILSPAERDRGSCVIEAAVVGRIPFVAHDGEIVVIAATTEARNGRRTQRWIVVRRTRPPRGGVRVATISVWEGEHEAFREALERADAWTRCRSEPTSGKTPKG